MNWLDITCVCLIGIALVKGLFDGVVKQVVSLIAVVAGLMFAARTGDWLRMYLVKLDWFPVSALPVVSYVLGFALIFAGCMLVAVLLHKLIGVTPLGILNHLFGALFGALTMVLFLSLFLNVWDVIDPRAALLSGKTRTESKLYAGIKSVVPALFPAWDFRKYLPAPGNREEAPRQPSRTVEV